MPKAQAPTPSISVIIPAYNEAENLEPLQQKLEFVLEELPARWEIIYIDDGSSDETWGKIEALNQTDSRIKGIRLSRNFGHQYALFAGLQRATGDAVISMDADLQHPPALLPKLFEQWQSGHKVVNTARLDPDDFSPFKRYTSRLFYRLFSYLSGVPLEPGMADFRLLDRQVVGDILKMREEGLFLRGIVQWVGYKSSKISFQSERRWRGVTKYTPRKMLQFAWHGLSSFSLVPLRVGVLIGFVTSGLSFLSILYAIYSKLIIGQAVPGWASSIAIISFLFGVLFMLLGVLGEYIGRILIEVRGRPRFLVSEDLGLSNTTSPSTSSTDHLDD